LSCNENDGDHMDREQQYPPTQKTKRMRTSFKHHQLRTMKSYFAINHNPDAKDLKQLAQKTGLTKRVLQVWFQNARAKFRRNLLRQENAGVDKASDGTVLQAATPSGPASEISNASLSPSSTSTTLTDLTNPSMPTVTCFVQLTNSTMDLYRKLRQVNVLEKKVYKLRRTFAELTSMPFRVIVQFCGLNKGMKSKI
ncbi:hypothetical protein scyTo_0013822, partial [Scyliorhinus torazame]|nr:hypothetical protein [Scyliorhinus torazame]